MGLAIRIEVTNRTRYGYVVNSAVAFLYHWHTSTGFLEDYICSSPYPNEGALKLESW